MGQPDWRSHHWAPFFAFGAGAAAFSGYFGAWLFGRFGGHFPFCFGSFRWPDFAAAPPVASTQVLTVNLVDVPEPPAFAHDAYALNVPESARHGALVGDRGDAGDIPTDGEPPLGDPLPPAASFPQG